MAKKTKGGKKPSSKKASTKKPTEKQVLQAKCDGLGIKYQPNDTITMLKSAIRGYEAEAKLAKAQELAGEATVTVVDPGADDIIKEAQDKIKAETSDGGAEDKADGVQESSGGSSLAALEAARGAIKVWGTQHPGGMPTGEGLHMQIQNSYPDFKVEAERPRNTMNQIAFRVSKGNESVRCPSEDPRDFFTCEG